MWDVTAAVHSRSRHNQPHVTKGSSVLLQLGGPGPSGTPTLTPGVKGQVAAEMHTMMLMMNVVDWERKTPWHFSLVLGAVQQ